MCLSSSFGQTVSKKETFYNKGHDKLFPDTLNQKRLFWSATTTGALYVGSISGLYILWYSDYDQSSFHTFNDNAEWMQVDKAGHALTSYYVGRTGYNILRWSGVKERPAIFYGGSLGFVFESTVEIFDGFSKGWGFSWGDIAANTFGSALFIGQQYGWHEQRISMKFSCHSTKYAQYRPDLLGSNAIESVLKDYNGQTIWLSANPDSFFGDNNFLPKWLNIAFGYGASGMTGAFQNSTTYNGKPIPNFDRQRRYFLSLDIDLSRIPTRSKFLAALFETLNFIKIPFPTLEYNSNDGLKGHWLYF